MTAVNMANISGSDATIKDGPGLLYGIFVTSATSPVASVLLSSQPTPSIVLDAVPAGFVLTLTHPISFSQLRYDYTSGSLEGYVLYV